MSSDLGIDWQMSDVSITQMHKREDENFIIPFASIANMLISSFRSKYGEKEKKKKHRVFVTPLI